MSKDAPYGYRTMRVKRKRPPYPAGDRIHEARVRGGITARELDRLAGITAGHTSLIESGYVRNVSAETAARIARVLGASLDWLLLGRGRAPSERIVKAAIEAARTPDSSTGTDG